MLYPTYTVNGKPMADPWGRWHEHPEQNTFPSYPGMRAASLSLAGVGGEVFLSQTPIEAQDFILHMVINAVNQFGERAQTIGERRQQLNENISELLRIFNTPQMTQGGHASISLHHSEVAGVITSGRLEASTEIEFDPEADYVEVQFIFRLPYGIWRGKFFDEKHIGSGSKRIAGLARSNAPVDGPFLVLVGPFTSATVTNEYGNGFQLKRTVGSNQAIAVNTKLWSVSPAFAVNPAAAKITPPVVAYTTAPEMSSVGLTSAVALTLLPRPEGATMNVSFVGGSGDSAVHVQTTEAYF